MELNSEVPEFELHESFPESWGPGGFEESVVASIVVVVGIAAEDYREEMNIAAAVIVVAAVAAGEVEQQRLGIPHFAQFEWSAAAVPQLICDELGQHRLAVAAAAAAGHSRDRTVAADLHKLQVGIVVVVAAAVLCAQFVLEDQSSVSMEF